MLFSAPGSPNPLESLETCPSKVHKNDYDRKFSSVPAERERRATPGAAPPGRIGARWPGGLGGSNRTESASGSGRQAQWRTGRPTGGGGRISGVDGVDMGRGIGRFKEYYREKGNICLRPARRTLPDFCPIRSLNPSRHFDRSPGPWAGAEWRNLARVPSTPEASAPCRRSSPAGFLHSLRFGRNDGEGVRRSK